MENNDKGMTISEATDYITEKQQAMRQKKSGTIIATLNDESCSDILRLIGDMLKTADYGSVKITLTVEPLL